MATLATLAAGLPGRFVLLTTLNAATQYLPARDLLRAGGLHRDVAGASTRESCGRFSCAWASSRRPR
jgi:transcription-repair coupling factor (superfamily II helicase)